MMRKNKNKLKLKYKNKILVLGLIVIILAGLFSPTVIARAETGGFCSITPFITEPTCENGGGKWTPNTTPPGQCSIRPILGYEDCLKAGGRWTLNLVTPPEFLRGSGTPGADTKTIYNPLAPLPGLDTRIDTAAECAFGKYLNTIVNLIIGLIAVAAVVMIVMGGLQYMTSEFISSKEAGKERIRNALVGLLIALGAYALLNTINPQLLNVCLDLPKVEITVDLGGEGTTPLNEATIQAQLQTVGIACPKSGGVSAVAGISQAYIGHSNYSQEKRNTTSNGKANIDCSAFVSQVYVCAGLPNPGGTTVGIFGAGSTSITSTSADGRIVNGRALRVGDLLGWKKGENGEANGHVVMFIGNDRVIDAQGSGVGVGIRSLTSEQFKGRFKYIKTAP